MNGKIFKIKSLKKCWQQEIKMLRLNTSLIKTDKKWGLKKRKNDLKLLEKTDRKKVKKHVDN